MSTDLLVSVIIPTYNSARTIGATLESLNRQTYSNIEVIVVDRFSQDTTLSIVSSRYPRAQILHFGSERSSQKNAGAAVARGEYLYFVDSDFVLEPTVISEAVRICQAGHEAVAVHNTSDPGVSFWARVRKLERDSYVGDPIHVAARFVQAELFRKIGGFDDELVAGDDYDLHIRLLMAAARIGLCNPVEYHIGEPTSLKEVARKHIYYGKYILGYVRKQFSFRVVQLSPLRAAYVWNRSGFVAHPDLLLGFLIYQYVRYTSAALGFLSALLSPPTSPGSLRPPSISMAESTEMSRKVSIVITTRNRPAEFNRCVGSLVSDIKSGAELVVVNDCSTVEYPKDQLPASAIIVKNLRRKYLNESRNIGARLSSREYVLFVDDDNTLEADALRQLAKTLDSFPAVGVAAPVALTDDRRVWYAGGSISSLTGITIFDYRGYPLMMVPKRLIDTHLFHNCFMVRSELLDSIGGFDSNRFPMYLGEADASEKLRRRGYRVVVNPKAVVLHGIEAAGVRSLLRNIHITEPVRAYYVGRNRILFMRLYSGTLRFLVFLTIFQPVIALIHLATIASIRHGRYSWTNLAGPYLRGMLDAIVGKVRFGSAHFDIPTNADLLRGVNQRPGYATER